MKPGNPWSVKGIQPAARQAAKEAARRHGMTLGQWLNHVIMDSNEEQAEEIAEQRPVPQPAPINQAPDQQPVQPQITTHQTAAMAPKSQRLHDKIEDLAARLDSIVDKQSGQVDLDQWEAKSSRTSGWNDIAVRNVKLDEAANSEAPPKPESESKSEIFGDRLSALTDKLDSVVQSRAETKSRSDQSLMELETALRNVINHIEVSDRQNTDVMKSIQTRLSDLSSRASASSNDTVQELVGAISEMDDRLAHMSQRVMKAEAESSEFLSFEEKIKSLTNRLDNSPPPETEPQILALEERTQQLASQLENFLRNSSDSSARDQQEAQLNEISKRIQNTESYASKFTSLEDSVSQLFDAVEQNRNMAQENTLSASQKSLETMETMVEQAAQKAAENAAQRSAEHVAAIMADDGLNKKEVTASIATLREEMHQLQDTALQAARSAEQTISAGLNDQATKTIAEPMMALRQEIDQLKESSKGAELRNQDTLEAVHDTLEKVVERLVTLEASPSNDAERSPLPSLSIPEINLNSPAEREQPFRASDEIGGIPSQEDLGADAELPAEGSIDPEIAEASNPAQPAQNDARIEPAFDTPDEQDGSSDKKKHDSTAPALNHNFLEAARRAAQAASQMPRNLPEPEVVEISDEENTPDHKNSLLAMATESDKKRKSLLLVAAAVLLVIGALSAGSLMTDRSSKIASSTIVPLPTETSKDTSSSTATKANKKSADDPAVTPSDIANPALSPVSQNTSQSPVKTAQISQSVTVPRNPVIAVSKPVETPQLNETAPPKIAPPTPTVNELTGITPAETAAKPIKVARVNTAATRQPATANDASNSAPLEPLPPEAIGPIALRRAAASGDATAQFEIAARYTAGKLVPQNFNKAIFWYQKAAAQELAPAQYRLGTFYEKGRGVTKDKAAARIWYERAAAKGNLKAIHNLAVIHADGSKGKPDFPKAGLWFRKAAELGLADSQYNLAILHDRGLGVSKDQSKAYFWFEIAGAQGDKDAQARAAIIEKRMTPDEIARTKLLISNWNPLTLNKSANEVALPFDGWQSGGTIQTTASTTSNSEFSQKELVVLTQGYLAKLGFDPGTADGILGAQTRQAIEEFQQRNQLPVSGDVSPTLVSKLKAAAG